MASIKDMKLLRSIINSQERKKYYSTNTNRIVNTYKCQNHNEYCSKICTKCNMDICTKCHKNYHYSHQVITYEEINPNATEIYNLQKQINAYINIVNILRRDINAWYNDLKNKLYDFEISLKNNEIINSIDFVKNFSKNKICLNTILKFRKIYYNIIQENNIKNKKILLLISQYENNNMKLPSYYDFFEINNLIQNLTDKDNFKKRGELIINYLSKIPYIENSYNNNNYSIEYNGNNDLLSQKGFIFNPFKSQNNLKNDEDLCDRSTGHKYSNEDYKTYSERRIVDSNIDKFRTILNKTKIPEFNLNSSQYGENKSQLNRTFNYEEKKNYNITDFTKYLNKMGLLNINENDLHKINSSQDLLNKSSYSIKSCKFAPGRSNSSTYSVIEKKTNDLPRNNVNPFIITKKIDIGNEYIRTENNENQINKEKLSSKPMKPLYSIKNAQKKTYVHKKFKINKINDKKNNIIQFQKKLIIINKSNKQNKNNNNIENTKKEENQIKPNNNEIKDKNEINDNYIQNKQNNSKILNQKIIRTKQVNDDIIKDNEKKDKIYSSPIKTELFQNAIISDDKKNIVIDYDKDNDESNINTTDKKNLFHIIYSPSTNKKQSTIKKNNNNDVNKNINFQTYKISNSTNMNMNLPNIVKTYKNSSFFVDPQKELCIGMELGNSDCKIGIVNQNTSEIQLVCFDDDKYSMPTLVSFSQNKKEIKIGYEAEKDLINNPSQTIFNIVKYFGVKYNDIKCRNNLWPFKIFYTNDEENRPYIKIDFGPQKDKIFYFENIIAIFLEKLFELIFNKVNLENKYNYSEDKIKKEDQEEYNNLITLNIILVLTVPNYFSYSQRKLIENIIKVQIFPEINDSDIKIYDKYKINLVKLKIENASSIGALCLLKNYDYNNLQEKNLLILNIDGGSANISITSSKNENEKIIYQVKSIKSLQKGEVDLVDDFMFEILQKFETNIKREILDSPLCLVKLRKICQKIKENLIIKKNDSFNIVEILENYDEKIEITRDEYENAICNIFNNIKVLILEALKDAEINEKDINDIIFIGQICREKKFHEIIEQLFISSIYEELIYSNYLDTEKDFYNVGGAAYHALNSINNNIYLFFDICPFDLGIMNYHGELNLIIKKGEKIPILKEKILKVKNENSLKIYEKIENENINKLIGTIELDNINNDIENFKYGFRELKIKFEVNDEIEIFISIFNNDEGKYKNKQKVNLLLI